MNEKPAPQAPEGLNTRGKALWERIHAELEIEAHEEALLLEVCRVLDRLEVLDAAIREEPPIVDGKVHPALTEARLQAVTLARLVASLRLPDDYAADVLERGQRRGAARGTYKLKAVN